MEFTNAPTIKQIKNATKEKAPYFFSAKNLRAHGQILDDWKVKLNSDKSRCFIYCHNNYADNLLFWGDIVGKEFNGFELWEFCNNDLKRLLFGVSLDQVLEYIENA